VGLISGPAVGAMLFAFSNFESTFLIMGFSFIVLCFILLIYIPSTVDKKDTDLNEETNDPLEKDEEDQSTKIHNSHPVTYTSLM
jgi:hypothetical protein